MTDISEELADFCFSRILHLVMRLYTLLIKWNATDQSVKFSADGHTDIATGGDAGAEDQRPQPAARPASGCVGGPAELAEAASECPSLRGKVSTYAVQAVLT